MAVTSDRILDDASSRSANASKLVSILVVDDEPGIRDCLKIGLEKHFGLVETATNAATADALCQRCHFDLVIANTQLPDRSGIAWANSLRQQGGDTALIFISAQADLASAIAALRLGASDFILKPFLLEQIIDASQRGIAQRRRSQRGKMAVPPSSADTFFEATGLIGDSSRMKNLCHVIKRIAPMPSTVLIEGESGTGKELVARAIHNNSGRQGGFVPINCSAMTAELLESELFGHVKGAFTGAHQSREGLFSHADGGTLFLDEIGEMPLTMQGHLLRALEERAIRPLGSNRETSVNVRIIAATNRNLADQVRQGHFREDLFFRLNVLNLCLPALRERFEDLPLLVRHFTETLSRELGVTAPQLDPCELLRLQAYPWPGNVRELRNVIERCLLLGSLPSQCLKGLEHGDKLPDGTLAANELRLDVVEKRHILNMLGLQGGNKSAAARHLGISRKTLERKLQAWESSGT